MHEHTHIHLFVLKNGKASVRMGTSLWLVLPEETENFRKIFVKFKKKKNI